MGPHPGGCGNRQRADQGGLALAASMGPHPGGCGDPPCRRRSTTTKACFNKAAPRGVPRRPMIPPLCRTAIRLQWGRTPKGAETAQHSALISL